MRGKYTKRDQSSVYLWLKLVLRIEPGTSEPQAWNFFYITTVLSPGALILINLTSGKLQGKSIILNSFLYLDYDIATVINQ